MDDDLVFVRHNKNGSMAITFDLAAQIGREVAAHKESLWKHFCRDVCERVVSSYTWRGMSLDMVEFREKFEKAFEEEKKKWMEDNDGKH